MRFSGKFDSLLREFSQLHLGQFVLLFLLSKHGQSSISPRRGFNQTLRNVVDTVSQSRKDLKELHQAATQLEGMKGRGGTKRNHDHDYKL